ncbi:MAG: D-alanine--D-alanine ligase family protein, partial [Cyclobacteriaceae bacterium]
LQILDVPYVGPDVLGSSIAMDKDIAKIQLAAAGINVAKGVVLTSVIQGNFKQIKASLGLPIFVKPANMGSSVGVHKVTNEDEFEKALKDAFQYDSKIVVEEMINGRELECAVLGLRDNLQVTMPGEVKAEEEYSFDEKYSESSQTQLDIPAKNLTETQITSLKKTAVTAFKALNCEILSRVDMFLTDEGKIYVNEINTLPGFTSISMYPQLWEKEGLSYSDLISQLLELAVQRHTRIKGLKKSRL